MSSPIVRVRVATLPPGEPPVLGGPRPLVTPLTGIEGAERLLRGDATAGLPPAASWAVVVRLEDADGREGTGTAGFGSPATVPVIEQLAPVVLGALPAEVNRLWETMFRATVNVGRRGVVMHAISALDIALWDLHARQLERPLHELLGGAVRSEIPAYASRLYATDDLDALAAEARGYVEQGFGAVKQRLAYGPSDGLDGIRRNVELVQTVADAIGPGVEQMADAYMGWDAGYAIRCIRAIEDAGVRLRWVEEPVMPDDVPGLARVRAAVDTPIAAGEHEATRFGFRDLVTAAAVDVLQPDVNRLGGITEARRVWALGETFGLDVIPHLGVAHNLQVAAASFATPMVEYMPPPGDDGRFDEDQVWWVLFPDEPRAQHGTIRPPRGPGLGVTLDDARLQELLELN